MKTGYKWFVYSDSAEWGTYTQKYSTAVVIADRLRKDGFYDAKIEYDPEDD